MKTIGIKSVNMQEGHQIAGQVVLSCVSLSQAWNIAESWPVRHCQMRVAIDDDVDGQTVVWVERFEVEVV